MCNNNTIHSKTFQNSFLLYKKKAKQNKIIQIKQQNYKKISPAYKDLIESPVTLPPPPPQQMQWSQGTGRAPAQG